MWMSRNELAPPSQYGSKNRQAHHWATFGSPPCQTTQKHEVNPLGPRAGLGASWPAHWEEPIRPSCRDPTRRALHERDMTRALLHNGIGDVLPCTTPKPQDVHFPTIATTGISRAYKYPMGTQNPRTTPEVGAMGPQESSLPQGSRVRPHDAPRNPTLSQLTMNLWAWLTGMTDA
ncbi:hypothetical protein PIB30_017008 [Stylosanthes scabra]|uniref:Uncharacterized protein n=1 Tax=Stylosanthes scabra TaxID=79078 RepID=A0ABU6Q885_9FABA|nr:hypothetical protein [Stylosanthes scabra]